MSLIMSMIELLKRTRKQSLVRRAKAEINVSDAQTRRVIVQESCKMQVVAVMLFSARDFAAKSGTLIFALRTTVMTQTRATKHCFYFWKIWRPVFAFGRILLSPLMVLVLFTFWMIQKFVAGNSNLLTFKFLFFLSLKVVFRKITTSLMLVSSSKTFLLHVRVTWFSEAF